MTTEEDARRIEVRRRGNALGFWFFKTSIRCFGLKGTYGLLYIVCAHYLLFDRKAVRAALAYVKRQFPNHGRLRQLADVYRLFISQGRNLIDRYYLISGAGNFEMHVAERDALRGIMDSGVGFVLVTAHVGNWQAIMTYLAKYRRKVNLVMRPEDNPAVQEALRIGPQGQQINIISPEGFLGGVVETMSALGRREVVSLMGDRSYGYSPVEVEFMGGRAWFASGALHIAAMAQCPAVVLFSAKTGTHSYDVDLAAVFNPRYQPGTPKADQLRGWAQDFARVLESYLARHPYQCFLFYDIWTKPEPPAQH
jgi:predicted LPLAT superfamily acyltransferase